MPRSYVRIIHISFFQPPERVGNQALRSRRGSAPQSSSAQGIGNAIGGGVPSFPGSSVTRADANVRASHRSIRAQTKYAQTECGTASRGRGAVLPDGG